MLVENLTVIIVVPSTNMTGPIKGAVALANGLQARGVDVSFFSLKGCNNRISDLHPDVAFHSLSNKRFVLSKIGEFRRALNSFRKDRELVSISYCFSADLLNLFRIPSVLGVSSVRGNLPLIYRYDYGILGWLLSYLHIFMLRAFDGVISMSASMQQQLVNIGGLTSDVIPNFLDEQTLKLPSKLENQPDRFPIIVFVGSLSERKRPLMLVQAFASVVDVFPGALLRFVGAGPLERAVADAAEALNLSDHVQFHGHVTNPLDMVAGSSLFVLPSLAEGTPRAALEALYCGVPCLLTEVDGNTELISHGCNGWLLSDDQSLDELLVIALRTIERGTEGRCLLPDDHRQWVCVDNHINYFFKLLSF